MYRVNKLTIQFQLDIGKWGILFAHEIILQSMSHACRLWTIVYRMNILTGFWTTEIRGSKIYKIADSSSGSRLMILGDWCLLKRQLPIIMSFPIKWPLLTSRDRSGHSMFFGTLSQKTRRTLGIFYGFLQAIVFEQP